MLIDLLILAGFVLAWAFLSPCSPWTVWKNASCALKNRPPPSDKT